MQDQRLRIEKMENIQHGFEKGVFFTVYVEHNSKIERSLSET